MALLHAPASCKEAALLNELVRQVKLYAVTLAAILLPQFDHPCLRDDHRIVGFVRNIDELAEAHFHLNIPQLRRPFPCLVVRGGVEPPSTAYQTVVLDRCTTGLCGRVCEWIAPLPETL